MAKSCDLVSLDLGLNPQSPSIYGGFSAFKSLLFENNDRTSEKFTKKPNMLRLDDDDVYYLLIDSFIP